MVFDLASFVRESNEIEGIYDFRPSDLEAHSLFMHLEEIIVDDLENFVEAVQPGAKLRDQKGMDVMVGNHVPIRGGPGITEGLEQLLVAVNRFAPPYQVYCGYEYLHPFMDGNGRSGRVLWLWLLGKRGEIRTATSSFLKTFHYQCLDAASSSVSEMLTAERH